MGTGLGCGAILYNPVSERHHVVEMEAGHCLIPYVGENAYPTAKDDIERLKYLGKKIYEREGHPVEFEDICSGRGLKACYDYEIYKSNDIPKFKTSKQSNHYFVITLIID